jgi:hypothetical protein
VTLIGEANQGPGFLDEPNLGLNSFTPSQLGQVTAKYGSGNIVDAFAKIVSASNDPNILGSVSLVYIVKTNMSQSATGELEMDYKGSPVYATVEADSQGTPGNLIQYQSEVAVAELPPNTGLIDYAPALTGTVLFAMRTNGGPAVNVTVTAKEAPNALVAAMTNIPQGILATGGQQLLVGASGLTLTAAPVNGSTTLLLVTLQTGNLWANSPQQGDVAVIPVSGDYGSAQTSTIAGAGNANAGTYIVQSVTNTLSTATMTLQKVSTIGTLTSATGSIHTDMTDLILYTQIQVQNISGDDRMFMTAVYGMYTVTTNTGSSVTMTSPSMWNATPMVGDNVKVPAAITLSSGSLAPGFYQVTAATNASMTMQLISSGSSIGSGTGTGTFTYSTGAEPMMVLSQYQLSGVGKTLAFEGTVSSIFLTTGGTDAGLSNSTLSSAAQYQNEMTIIAGLNNSQTYQSGGTVVISIGYESATAQATVTVGPLGLTFAVNSVTQFTATFAQYPTMGQLASYIDSQTGWSASVPSAQNNNQNTSNLDQGTYNASSSLPGVQNLQLKQDAFAWETANNMNAQVTWTTERPGLPEPSSNAFLTGGTLGGTTSAAFAAAVDATQKLSTNFIVPLFSQNASLDIPLGLTDPSSTYTIDAMNEYLLSNVLLMSELTQKSNRMAIGSKLGTFPQLITAAGELASFRFGLAFEPIQTTNAFAQSILYQPWMAAVVAAGMQAAAGYKGIVKKFANINGIGTVTGFDPTVPGNRIAALQAGLLFMEPVATGGFRWVSDQTTYNTDNNFVYNSIQAVYVSDLISLALIDRFDRSVAGKSVADITATAALGIFEAEMFNYKRLKWIAPSSDAPKGYKNAVAQLDGVAMVISAEIKLAGLIYFVPIALLVSQVTQTATQNQP